MDALRGFALLGILLMNIQSFSMINAAYTNPTAYGDLTGLNRIVWFMSHTLADNKFMTLFSVLFGTSILLFTERAESRGGGVAVLYFRRLFFLILFGMLHAYLLWYGDILVAYGVCGMLAYFFRKRKPLHLLIMGLSLVSVPFLIFSLLHWAIPFMGEADLAELVEAWAPSTASIVELNTAYQGSWLEQMSPRVSTALELQTVVFGILISWRVGGLMLIGMALYRWNILSAARSDRFYAACVFVGLGVGLPIVIYGVQQNFAHGWDLEYSFFLGSQYNFFGSLFVSLGYLGSVMLVWRRGWCRRALLVLAKVGRMAFTNYILQSLICTTIFYGHGLGLFGSVSRTGQLLIVIGVWILIISFTHLWLRSFRFGPLEWLWRALTYLKFQPMRTPASR